MLREGVTTHKGFWLLHSYDMVDLDRTAWLNPEMVWNKFFKMVSFDAGVFKGFH